MATQVGRSGTFVGHAPPPTAAGSADATGIQPVQLPAVSPPPDLAFAATAPAMPPRVQELRHPSALALHEHSAETLAALTPELINTLIEANSSDWSRCTWHILAELDEVQRPAVPNKFYRHMGDKFLSNFSEEQYRQVPSWLMNAMGVPPPTARDRTMMKIAGESGSRARAYKALVIGVPLIGLAGLWLVLRMAGWL